MPLTITDKIFYRTAEACRLAGISKNTFHRWVREGSFTDVEHRDRRGWRLFTECEVDSLKSEANRIRTIN
jgi:predicted site-specific integrase-resolvase